jgi:hypothetical protein
MGFSLLEKYSFRINKELILLEYFDNYQKDTPNY